MPLPIPFRPDLPMLLDSGSVIGSVKDPAAALAGTKYKGRIFYLKRADWEKTRFPDYISRSEADSYKRNEKAIVLNFEDAAANWCLGGYAVGKDRGNVSAAQLKEIDCENAAVYMSIDFRPSSTAEMDACMECLRGFQDSALGRRGRAVYGFAEVLREAKKRGLADYFWLCGDGRRMYREHEVPNVPDDTDLMGTVNIWQQNNEQPFFAGVQIDDNYIYTPDDYGQWKPGKWEERFNMADANDVMKQLFGEKFKGWAFLGLSSIAEKKRDNTVVEALAEIRDQLVGPDHNFGGWPQLGFITPVDALSVIGWWLGIPKFDPPAKVREKLGLTDEMRPFFGHLENKELDQ